MTGLGGSNRYADKRRATRARVQLQARYASANLVLDGHITDISADGLFFSSDYLDGRGELASVSVCLPARNVFIELRGEVRWVNEAQEGSGMGIRLIDVSLEDRLLLSSLCEDTVELTLPV